MTKLIGLTGKAGSGKDTAAAKCRDLYDGWTYSLAFATGVKQTTATLYNVDILKLYEAKDEVDHYWGITYRTMLQKVGVSVRDLFGKDFWIKSLESDYRGMRAARDYDIVFVTDVRFDNEAEWIKRNGGIVVQVVRPMVTTLEGAEAEHASEKGVHPGLIDVTITNSRSPKELGESLYETVESFYDEKGPKE